MGEAPGLRPQPLVFLSTPRPKGARSRCHQARGEAMPELRAPSPACRSPRARCGGGAGGGFVSGSGSPQPFTQHLPGQLQHRAKQRPTPLPGGRGTHWGACPTPRVTEDPPLLTADPAPPGGRLTSNLLMNSAKMPKKASEVVALESSPKKASALPSSSTASRCSPSSARRAGCAVSRKD